MEMSMGYKVLQGYANDSKNTRTRLMPNVPNHRGSAAESSGGFF